MKTQTPTPWRIGDAGGTIFGPKTDNPSPTVVCCISKNHADVKFIVRACNAYERDQDQIKELLEACKEAASRLNVDEPTSAESQVQLILDRAISKAEQKGE